MPELYILQDEGSRELKIACKLEDGTNDEVNLLPGESIKVADCECGEHILNVGTALNAGKQWTKLTLSGATYHGGNTIEDLFNFGTGRADYTIEVI